MVRVANTVLTDTFDTWRVNTNKLAHIIEEMDGGNATDGGTEPYAGNVHATSLVSNNLIVKAGGNTGISGYVNFANATQVVFKTSDIRVRGAANNSVYTRSNILKLKATADGQVEWGNVGFNEIANSISSSQIPTGAITAGKIDTGGVSANTQLAAGVVTSHAIESGGIDSVHLSSDALSSNTKFAAGVITSHAIQSGGIDGVHLATEAVSANTKLAAGVVTSHAIESGGIDSVHLSSDALSSNTKFAAGVITSHAIQSGGIDGVHLATEAVSANTKLAAGVVTSHAVAAEAIGNTHIKDGGIAISKLSGSQGTSARIANVQYFHSGGIQTWTKPSNVDTVQAIVIGGGGGGMTYPAPGYSTGAMGGMAVVTVESLSNPVRVVVGTGGSAGGTTGGTGGTSVFGPPTPTIDPVGSPAVGAYAYATGGSPGPSGSGLLAGIGSGNTSTTTVAIAGKRTTPMRVHGWVDAVHRSAMYGGVSYTQHASEDAGLDPTRVFRNMGVGGQGGSHATAYTTPGSDESPPGGAPASTSPGFAGSNGGVIIIGYHNES
jgi:hypothetical protein